MSKIKDDKYYTSKIVANYCLLCIKKIIGFENISEIIEPSAGNGSFSNLIKDVKCLAYDIKPEHPSIIKQDFLTLDLDYKPKRLILGNPPFGDRMNLAQKFYKKSVTLGDYVAFILPISQLNNSVSLFEFDLIYSLDLETQRYSDRDLHCCFNIYKRNISGNINKRKSNKLKDIIIYRQDSKKYLDCIDYDIRMCYWGNGSAGKILSEDEHYSAEYKIKILNKKLKQKIYNFIVSFDWNTYCKGVAMCRLKQFHIIEVLKKNIQGIK